MKIRKTTKTEMIQKIIDYGFTWEAEHALGKDWQKASEDQLYEFCLEWDLL